MCKAIYKLTREIAIILSVVLTIILFNRLEIIRLLCNILLTGLFIYTSKLYEKRYNIITPSYILIFFIIFIVNTFISGYYDWSVINESNAIETNEWMAGDYYSIYFAVDCLCYFAIIIYLKKFCKNIKYKENFLSINIGNNATIIRYIIALVAIIALYIIFGRRFELLVPCFVFTEILIIYKKKYRIFGIILLLIMLLINRFDIIKYRFEFVEIVVPILFAIAIFSKRKKINFFKVNILFICFILLLGLYGTISEVYKLNEFWGGDYVLTDILFSEQFFVFLKRQFVRLFAVWNKLGGYIIYHVHQNGFFYGVTYIKSIASLFGLEYVSLPTIAATYNQSTYSQPGLLAEGYANFGILGAATNIVIVFFVMEYFIRLFMKKPSCFTFMLATVPFTKILIDGGSLNSAIYIIIFCLILGSFNIYAHYMRRNIRKRLVSISEM